MPGRPAAPPAGARPSLGRQSPRPHRCAAPWEPSTCRAPLGAAADRAAQTPGPSVSPGPCWRCAESRVRAPCSAGSAGAFRGPGPARRPAVPLVCVGAAGGRAVGVQPAPPRGWRVACAQRRPAAPSSAHFPCAERLPRVRARRALGAGRCRCVARRRPPPVACLRPLGRVFGRATVSVLGSLCSLVFLLELDFRCQVC